MPRPKQTTDQSRRHTVRFRVNDAELTALRLEADAAGLSHHECAREKACGAAPPQCAAASRADLPLTPTTLDFYHQFIRAGSNLNQIARRLHMTGDHEPDELHAVLANMHEIVSLIMAEVTFH